MVGTGQGEVADLVAKAGKRPAEPGATAHQIGPSQPVVAEIPRQRNGSGRVVHRDLGAEVCEAVKQRVGLCGPAVGPVLDGQRLARHTITVVVADAPGESARGQPERVIARGVAANHVVSERNACIGARNVDCVVDAQRTLRIKGQLVARSDIEG